MITAETEEKILVTNGPSYQDLIMLGLRKKNRMVFQINYGSKNAAISVEVVSIILDSTKNQMLKIVCKTEAFSWHINHSFYMEDKIGEGKQFIMYYSIKHNRGYIE